jgi:hypothetical protein
MTQNIEDTIFNDYLPVNPYPMATRLQQLLDENIKLKTDWKQDKRIEKLLYLILITWDKHLELSNINFNDWWMQLHAQHEGEKQPCSKL